LEGKLTENSAVCFKIAEHGRDGTSSTWGDTPLMTTPETPISTPCPAVLLQGIILFAMRSLIYILRTHIQVPNSIFLVIGFA
jgi:hypothetical protein